MNSVEKEKSEIRRFSEETIAKIDDSLQRTNDSIIRIRNIRNKPGMDEYTKTELMTIEADLNRIRQSLTLIKSRTDSIVAFSERELNQINKEVIMLSDKLEGALKG